MEGQKKEKKEVEILKRAHSYANEVDAIDKAICMFDYFAGAQEERILLLEWKDAEKEAPDTDRQVLTKDRFGCYRVAYYGRGHWSEAGVRYWRDIEEIEEESIEEIEKC